ncbi:MAG: hypothetical protein GY795_45180 [Desulfobacterales bacterium]|nr:hypothetical protein [Desulfobacterales bacterium]
MKLLYRILFFIFFFGIGLGFAEDNGKKITAELIFPEEIDFSEMSKVDEGYSYSFKFKMKLRHNLKNALNIRLWLDPQIFEAWHNFELFIYDETGKELSVYTPLYGVPSNLGKLRISSLSKLNIPLSHDKTVIFTKKGMYKVIGKFIFTDITGNYYTVTSKPAFLFVK